MVGKDLSERKRWNTSRDGGRKKKGGEEKNGKGRRIEG